MKIKKVQINNFRNYYGKHDFLLDKNITILFGENGYGKSSFFDAIEWCITNEIERFKPQDGDLSFSNYDCVNYLVRDGEEATCYVSIYYDQYRLCRTYDANTNLTNVCLYRIFGESEELIARGQKKVESHLSKSKAEADGFGGKLIKHSYILSQDQVTNFIRSNPKERFDSLASIMGINKITSFIDNLKAYATSFESFCGDLEKEIFNKSNMLKDRSNEWIEYQDLEKEIQNLEKGLTKLNIYDKDAEIHSEQIANLIRKVNKKLMVGKQKLDVLDKVPTEYKNYIQLKKRHGDLEGELESIMDLFTRIDSSKSSTVEELKSLENSLNKITNQKGVLKEIEDKKVEIEELKLQISKLPYQELDNNGINQEFNKCYQYLPIIEYTLLYYKDFHRAQEKLKEIPQKIEENQIQRAMLKEQIEKRKDEIVGLRNWLDENNVNASLQGLVKYLQGIYEYVQSNNVEGICPVCSSRVGDGLNQQINHNLIHYASQISEKEIDIMKMIEVREQKEKELLNLESKYKEIEHIIIRFTNILEESKETIGKVTRNKKYNEKLFNTAEHKILEAKSKLTNRISQLEEVRDKKNMLLSIEENYNALLKGMNIQASDKSIEITLKKRETLLTRKDGRLDKLNKSIQEKLKNLQSEQVNLLSLMRQLENYDDLLGNSRSFFEEKNTIEKEFEILNQSEIQLNQLRDLLIKKGEKEDGLKILAGYEGEVQRLTEELGALYAKKDSLNAYIKQLTTNVGEHALEFLNHPNSKIQQYYRYLNPVPAVNGTIQFVTDNSDEKKRGLSISIPVKTESGELDIMNARYTLSSAQLNTLAISIFLIVNDSQNVGIFDFVAIDDPIQNMDDVNRYTMCDILGEIEKQLIFSTHDLEFLKLFTKKNEHKREDIRIYFLENPNLLNGKVRELTF
ncbi:SMC family ATPase [Bacillus cereus]|nr:SMC family ATPase [Bacillus cereus]MCU5143237.1 SMC family ATPase [Bacillus cereus]